MPNVNPIIEQALRTVVPVMPVHPIHPISPRVKKDFAKYDLVAMHNDLEEIEYLYKKLGEKLKQFHNCWDELIAP